MCKGQGQVSMLSHTASSTSVISQVSAATSSGTFHPDGNIIVSADYTGQIKVFRQDCAWAQRRAAELSETASIRVRNKNAITRGSSSSIRPSGFASWRNSNTPTSRAGSTRSSSRRNSDANSSQVALSQKNLEVPKPGTRANGRTSPSPTRSPSHIRSVGASPDRVTRKQSTPQERLMLQEDGQSMAFYRIPTRQESVYSGSERSASVSPNPGRHGSVSSEPSLEDEQEGSFVDAEERLSNDDMVCRNCGARTFNAFKVQSGSLKGETKLRCSVCKHVFD